MLHGYAANLTDPEAVKELVNTIVDKYGRIDVLVNNAGISQKVTVADMTLDDIKRIFKVNMFGLFLITQAVCRSDEETELWTYCTPVICIRKTRRRYFWRSSLLSF